MRFEHRIPFQEKKEEKKKEPNYPAMHTFHKSVEPMHDEQKKPSASSKKSHGYQYIPVAPKEKDSTTKGIHISLSILPSFSKLYTPTLCIFFKKDGKRPGLRGWQR